MTFTLSRPMFLFDADCGVCQNGTDGIRERIDPPLDIVGFQTIDVAEFGVSERELAEGPVLVFTDGTHVVGPLAIAHMLKRARAPYSFIGTVMLLPGLRQLLSAIGPTMYRHKDRLPGSTPACSVTPGATQI